MSVSASTSLPVEKTSSALDDIVTDVCDKKIVLLGEDSSHGSGQTMKVKITLIKRLMNECGFSAIFFESPVYEFLNLEQSLLSKSSTLKQLEQSIGGLWSTAKPMSFFISELRKEAINGKVKLFGIDAQLGSANQPFTQKKLPRRIARYLSGERKEVCEGILYQYLNWEYDEKSPYNDATKMKILSCVLEIKNRIDTLDGVNNRLAIDKFMIENFVRFLNFGSENYFNLRDKAMAKNVVWHMSKLPSKTKAIIWCATIHAAKSLSPFSTTSKPMGFYVHQYFPRRAASIGFSALTGIYGRSEGNTKTINEGMLEKTTLSNSSKNIVYLDSKKLVSYGKMSAHPINYNKMQSANWADVLDGIIVLRKEMPLEYR